MPRAAAAIKLDYSNGDSVLNSRISSVFTMPA